MKNFLETNLKQKVSLETFDGSSIFPSESADTRNLSFILIFGVNRGLSDEIGKSLNLVSLDKLNINFDPSHSLSRKETFNGEFKKIQVFDNLCNNVQGVRVLHRPKVWQIQHSGQK